MTRALTIRQPWASLIAEGIKTVETRSWSTKYRGELAIHAGLHRPEVWMGEEGPYGEIWNEGSDGECLVQWAQTDKRDFLPGRLLPLNERWWLAPAPDFPSLPMPLGFVVATCELVDVLATADVQSDPYGDFTPGRFAWILADVQKIDPVPAKGKQGLWNWEAL